MENELDPLSPESGVGPHSKAKRCFLNLIEQNYMWWLFCFWLCWVLVVAGGIFSCSIWDLVPWLGIEPGLPALRVQCVSHWTTREVLGIVLKNMYSLSLSSGGGHPWFCKFLIYPITEVVERRWCWEHRTLRFVWNCRGPSFIYMIVMFEEKVEGKWKLSTSLV